MAHEKHTPGPWRVREMGTNERGPVLAIQSELYTIAEYIQPIDDARLIAAAPKLLAALESARGAIEYMQPLWEKDLLGAKVLTSLNAIDAAIAEALGEPS